MEYENTRKDSSINLDELCSDDECEDRQKPLPLPECFGQGQFSVTDTTSTDEKRGASRGTNSRTSYFGTKQLKLFNMELDLGITMPKALFLEKVSITRKPSLDVAGLQK